MTTLCNPHHFSFIPEQAKRCKLLGVRHCRTSILAGRDDIDSAQTGSCKMAAFPLLILHMLNKDPYHPYVVLTPTREWTSQIADRFDAFGSPMAVRCAFIIGDVDMPKQSLTLVQPHIVVTTTTASLINNGLVSIFDKLPMLNPSDDNVKGEEKKNCKPKIREGKKGQNLGQLIEAATSSSKCQFHPMMIFVSSRKVCELVGENSSNLSTKCVTLCRRSAATR
ncbi:hypothetical protein PF004_g12710 [Phytophthora fragariae]|uniref:ATP-dependent RNA helicase n=1 Tax=Phytophthora fragariae TaxID=53985 RepID=A0A6G0NUB1_9STRA|nr:hypothetical protein PF004_g12710 [Phytophthora fragariae]